MAPRPRKQSSPALSSLAARVLRGVHRPSDREIRQLAASVLSQDVTKGQEQDGD